ncbi:sorting nexin-8 [Microdochium nivale]|nr:sorting nexin-8 [Microdochium nivale]
MNSAGDAVTLDKKLHPFFSGPKSTVIIQNGSVATPVTPDPSCSPASERAHEMPDLSGREPAADMTREAKRRKVDCGSGNGLQSLPTSQPQTIPEQPRFLGLDEMPLPTESIAAPAAGAPITKKLLSFNPKTGTIGSPPKPKIQPVTEEPGPKKRRQPRRALLIRIKYASTDLSARQRLAKKIDGINKGALRVSEPVTVVPPAPSTSSVLAPSEKPSSTMGKSSSSKSTHPFFVGKLQAASTVEIETPAPPPPKQKRQSIFTSTPCSPKKPKQPPSQLNPSAFGTKTGLLKFPGAQHPPFPWKGLCHVRDVEEMASSHYRRGSKDIMPAAARRKAKGHHTAITDEESLMTHTLSQLNIDTLASDVRYQNGQDFKPPPTLLRVPSRHFESGRKLQSRISGELSTTNKKLTHQHPAIRSAFARICSDSSAFDKSTCESMAWTTKYAPVDANTVLQSGQEAHILRDWLHALIVQSVDTGSAEVPAAKLKDAQKLTRKKRRRHKLDSFIVSDSDESGFMEPGSDDEMDWMADNGKGGPRKTVSRPIIAGPRLSNTILLSGPHGCGKTAAVYAVAKELDFEIFELNPGSRRSGRDILERVGDMTRNHLVRHHQAEEGPVADIEDEVARDLKSGKQGTMTSFFTSKTAQVSKPSVAPKAQKASAQVEIQPEIRKPAKSQKQSLILLEEVDILFEEDKQFWVTVMGMILQSRRPFVMTCTDETAFSVPSLNLHGILRFSPAPIELAVDLLLLIAANEGHSLQRSAVEGLYETRHHDLRASITELNYWCQIGVGDPQGGFNWFFPRWPKGVDKDEHGDTIRVISAGTYQRGMGWVARDVAEPETLNHTADGQLQHNVWNEWGVDISHAGDSFSSWAHDTSAFTGAANARLEMLSAADAFKTALSDADVYSFKSHATKDDIYLDTTLPPLPNKTKDDNICGQRFLETHAWTEGSAISSDVLVTINQLVQSLLPPSQQSEAGHAASPEERAVSLIQKSFAEPQAKPVTRVDYSAAFDVLAISEKVLTGSLDPSVFDRTMRLITLDVAPYVRSIVAYDERLRQERLLRSNILSEGGKPRKKMRTTRSALSALEGGVRASTRREKYFTADINTHLVLRTGGAGWGVLSCDGGLPGASQGTESGAGTSPQTGDEEELPRSRVGRRSRLQVQDESPDELA